VKKKPQMTTVATTTMTMNKPYHRTNLPFKHMGNDTFVSLLVHFLREELLQPTFTVICLDSPLRSTTQALVSHGICSVDQVILIEHDSLVYKDHLRHGMMAVQGSCNDIFSSFYFSEVNAFYLDVDGSIQNNQSTIFTILENVHLYAAKFILGYTFCQRTNGGSFDSHYESFMAQVRVLLKRANLKCIYKTSQRYADINRGQSPMFTEFMVLEHRDYCG
jgi:hypothetical protein